MFKVEQLSRANELSGDRRVLVVEAEWDYRDSRLNWNRAMSFIPLNWGHIWVRMDHNDVVISYGL